MNKSITQHESALRTVRNGLAARARRRKSHTFTSDDVHTILDSSKFRKVNRQRVMTATFTEGNFYKMGYKVPSARKVARGRRINTWSTYEVMSDV